MIRPAVLALSLLIGAAPAAAQAPVPEVEDSDVRALPAASPHWVFINTNFNGNGIRIFDGDTAKMVGMLNGAQMSNFAADPKGRYFYVVETMWSKGNRGTRQDMITVRDAHTFKIVREIALPGRLLVGNRKHDVGVSADGRFAYVYNMDPSTSVIVVDLDRGRVDQTVEVPGCGLSAAVTSGRVLSLCADGALAVTTLATGKKGAVTRSPSFFSAEDDPIFDNFPIDTASGRAEFVTYSGLIYSAALKDGASAGAAWSLQEAAGLPRGTTAPLSVNWYPGGRQVSALHAASNRLYVLMHTGEFWSQKEPGTELWVLDAAKHTLIARKTLDHEASYVEVSQDGKPLLFLVHEGKLHVLDALTLEEKHSIEEVGGGPLSTVGSGS